MDFYNWLALYAGTMSTITLGLEVRAAAQRRKAGAQWRIREAQLAETFPEETFNVFRNSYPSSALEDQAHLRRAFDALSVQQRIAAQDGLLPFLHARRNSKYLPKAADYLEHRMWLISDLRAMGAARQSSAAAA